MKAPIPDRHEGYPVVSPAQMREIDRRAIEEYGIPSIGLMESAGKLIAEEIKAYLLKNGHALDQSTLVTVCCGRGNNGGDGLVVARYLKEAGCEVMVYIAPNKRDAVYPEDVNENLTRANAAGVSVHQVSEELVELDVRLRSSAVIIDALLGTGASGKPAGYTQRMVQRITKSGKPVIAIDLPTGLNPETGYHSGAIISAVMTCTLGLPKTGLMTGPAKKYVGELKILDIGFPEDLIRKVVSAGGRLR